MDKAKKRQIKKILRWVSLAVAAVFLAVVPLLAESNSEAEGKTASILSGTVSTGDISTVIHGGGTLTEEAAVEVTIPYGVKLTEFLVDNGDAVAAGDPVAIVDPVSIMKAIMQVQQTLDGLEKNIEKAADAQVSEKVVALAGGRVKQIYGQPGDSVRDIMLVHGSLAVLSLDGLMAVDIKAEIDISAGESVTLVLTDGSTVSGRVESVLADRITVTVEDAGYVAGELVTVLVNDEKLGAGELYIHNAWKATAYSGTVSKVSVKAEDTVSAGKALFTLTDTAYTAEFDLLTAQHREYHAVMQELFRLYQDNTIRAFSSGIVSGVDLESEYLLGNSSEDPVSEQYSLEEHTILTVIPQGTMTLTITLDERDLSKVSLGQMAQVKVAALGGETVDATVTAIGTRGSNHGGNSKFAVELTLTRGAQMLPGMSAAACITLSTAERVPMIPVAALCEDGSKTIVYTAYNAQTGELSDPVSVELGVSDGIHVQILSGLEAGETYYYAYYDMLELDTDAS
ncbi:MAG: HlyD family efflux transporter periplasmic adaptor subunit [Oscillospiraceae bacterium]|nr:HlyD family efflux transporter periplasmic adaptor subunit [Oscillospiraceae bacterium]